MLTIWVVSDILQKMTSRLEFVTETPTIEESRQMSLGFISEKGTASFEDIDAFIKDKKLRFFNPPLFVVDNDPAHPEPHPLDEYLMLQEAMGTISIDKEGEIIRWMEPAVK